MSEKKIKFNTHITFVSDQAYPAIAPYFDSEIRPKKFILLTTAIMNDKAEILKEFLISKNIDCEIKQIEHENNFEKLLKELDKIIDKLETDNTLFNITCGTKLMSIVAFSVSSMHDISSVYLNVSNGIFSFFKNINDMEPLYEYELKPNLKIEDILKIYGIADVKTSNNKYHKYAKELFRKKGEICSLNKLARIDSNDCLKPIEADTKYIANFILKQGLVEKKHDCINFKNENIQKFYAGGWFEEYVYYILSKNKNALGIDDIKISVSIASKDAAKKPDNEFDIAFVKDETLHVIECKTKKYNNKTKRSTDDEYKLFAAVERMNILKTKKSLISYFNIDNTADIKRAHGLDIKIITAESTKFDPQRFEQKIIDWVNK